jgi:hypothetical protein
MNLLPCSSCFKNKSQKIRACHCTRCNDCLLRGENSCECGGYGNFKEISEDLKRFLEVSESFNRNFNEKWSQTSSNIRNIVKCSIEESKNIETIKVHQEEMKNRRLMERIKGLEEEKAEMSRKGKTGDLKFLPESWNRFEDDSKIDLKHDFSPFEGLWGRSKR